MTDPSPSEDRPRRAWILILRQSTAGKGKICLSWTFEEVDARLKTIMQNICKNVSEAAEKYSCPGSFVAGANIAALVKIADAMLAQGIV